MIIMILKIMIFFMTNLGFLKKKNIIFHFFCDAKMNNSPVLIISNLKYNVY